MRILISGAFLLCLSASVIAADATQERLEAPDREPNNWLLPRQNYAAHNYSPLSQINRDNAAQLQVAFTVPLSEHFRHTSMPDLQGAALVDDGHIFTDADNYIYRVDATSGHAPVIQWRAYMDLAPGAIHKSRGIAFWNDLVVRNLSDGRVVAINRNSGDLVWDSQIARVRHPQGSGGLIDISETFTSTPLVADGKVLVGNSNGDWGSRGWVAAVNVNTGEELWRFYTVPGPGEPGHESWADDHNAWRTGGGAIWSLGSYDVDQRLFIQGTANPTPMFDWEFRPGDNLFTNSAIALDIDDGSLAWYFQYTPNESWDYDEAGSHLLVDAPYNGEDRQMVVHFGRNGFYYQLDRTDGSFISATQYVNDVTWTAGIDPQTGKPVEYDPSLTLQHYRPESRPSRADTEVKFACPQLGGGVAWQPPAFDPTTMIAYAFGQDGCHGRMIATAVTRNDGRIDEQGRTRGQTIGRNLAGLVSAIDVTTGAKIADLHTPYPNLAGGIVTAGGILITAFYDGMVVVLDSSTLEPLWSFNTGIGFKAQPTTYSWNNRQYIAIVAGSRMYEWAPELGVVGSGAMLYVFGLPEPGFRPEAGGEAWLPRLYPDAN